VEVLHPEGFNHGHDLAPYVKEFAFAPVADPKKMWGGLPPLPFVLSVGPFHFASRSLWPSVRIAERSSATASRAW
jgi:hypothetical protein